MNVFDLYPLVLTAAQRAAKIRDRAYQCARFTTPLSIYEQEHQLFIDDEEKRAYVDDTPGGHGSSRWRSLNPAIFD